MKLQLLIEIHYPSFDQKIGKWVLDDAETAKERLLDIISEHGVKVLGARNWATRRVLLTSEGTSQLLQWMDDGRNVLG